jgi:rhodanese-related sulfurtransferase
MHVRFTPALACTLVLSFLGAASIALAEGNRYDLPRNYHSEISAAEAYITTHSAEGHRQRAVIVDVRKVEEYAAGHPEKAIHIPYPHIHGNPGAADYIAQSPEDFVNAVIAAIPDRSTPIFTLCRTGHRSVLAANLLAGAGYSNVRNIWQGFVGNTKKDVANQELDLNNNGSIDDGDKDGWGGYQGLPYKTDLHPQRIYAPYAYMY